MAQLLEEMFLVKKLKKENYSGAMTIANLLFSDSIIN